MIGSCIHRSQKGGCATQLRGYDEVPAKRKTQRREATAQEHVIKLIIKGTDGWCQYRLKNDEPPLVVQPVTLLDCKIVHGFTGIDLLITLLARDEREVMRFVREVIQRTPWVRGTQTAFVSFSRAFPGPPYSPVPAAALLDAMRHDA